MSKKVENIIKKWLKILAFNSMEYFPAPIFSKSFLFLNKIFLGKIHKHNALATFFKKVVDKAKKKWRKIRIGKNLLIPANIFLGGLLMFLVGVSVRLLINISSLNYSFLSIVGLIILIVYYFYHTNSKILFIGILFLGFFIGVLRTDLAIEKANGWIDYKFKGVGEVVRFAEPKDDYQRIYMKISGQKLNKFTNKIIQEEVVLLFVPLGGSYEYGRSYTLECDLKTAENKYAKFNYKRFLAGKKVYQICHSARIGQEIVKKNNGIKNYIFRVIYKFNKLLERKMNRLFPMPESAYLAGLLLGGDNRLPKNISESFRRTGTTHTVAVSGYNITILAEVFMTLGIFIGLWRRQAFWFVLAGITVFIIMIGAPSSAVRAAIMGIILLYASQAGRLANSVRIIILTAVIMVYISPFIILYDAGFQLSFLATLGIILIYGPLAEKFKIEKDFLGIKSIILVTISAQIGVLGVLIYTFDSISIVSLLANVIILPMVPGIMLGGVLAVGGAFITEQLGILIALPTWLALHFEIESVKLLAKIPKAIIEFENIGIGMVLIYYLMLGVILIGVEIKSRSNKNM
jgi:competence protein ComEC